MNQHMSAGYLDNISGVTCLSSLLPEFITAHDCRCAIEMEFRRLLPVYGKKQTEVVHLPLPKSGRAPHGRRLLFG